MRIDSKLMDELTVRAQESPRRRMNYDLRDTVDDLSQKMLNALEPDTVIPVHRHRTCLEVVVMLRGHAVQYLYDESGKLEDTVELAGGEALSRYPGACPGMVIEKGRWHRLESLESGTVLMECKEGPYAPLSEEDIYNG